MYDEAYQSAFIGAAVAGADIIQGSQAHFPMGFEFSSNSLIHYGLGNFLFDQMDYPVEGTRREFIDRHVIYDGEYINTELLTALLTDWSKPVPMTNEERAQFLVEIFKASKLR
jgi:poly-gamma-glutamate synthesis protein (capsule biosynthesis protein)